MRHLRSRGAQTPVPSGGPREPRPAFWAAALFFGLTLPVSAAPKVESFSPQGLVKKARQVTARFTEPMVAFGDPRPAQDPFDILCPAAGTGRWADGRNWVYDFSADLPAGLRCEFRLRGGLRSVSGGLVEGWRYQFHTGGPSIAGSEPYEGEYSRIAEDQIFVLALDTEAVAATVIEHAAFSVEGLPERVGARLVGGEEAAGIRSAAGRLQSSAAVVLLQARQRFPAGAVVRLVWGKGIAAPSGVETEEDQTLVFKTREEFTARFSCERANAREGCIPFLPMTLSFSAPVSWEQARNIRIQLSSGGSWQPETPSRQEEDSAFVDSLRFNGPFPAERELDVVLPSPLLDDSGRTLANAAKFPLAARTADYPPLAKFPARFGLLELKASPVLPVTLRSLEPEVEVKGRLLKAPAGFAGPEILHWLDRVYRWEHEWDRSLFAAPAGLPGPAPKGFSVPKPNGAKAFEVVGIPLNEPGFYVVELESPLLGQALFEKPTPMYVPAAALVTNLSAHLKWGRESSLVWVTRLDSGEPVAGAEVRVCDCEGRPLWEGRSDASGIARLGELPAKDELPHCGFTRGPAASARLVVTAREGEDATFVLDSWDDGIEPWRFELPYDHSRRPVLGRHTVFDRTLLRAGETVRMKHFLRRHSMAGFAFPPREEHPARLWIEHAGSGQKFELPLSWEGPGIAQSAWTIPQEAKLGAYRVALVPAGRQGEDWIDDDWVSGSLRVEEFRVPLMQAVLQPPAAPLVRPKTVPVHLAVKHLSGGGASGLAVRLRSQAQPRPAASFAAFEGFAFANGPAATGEEERLSWTPAPELERLDLKLDAAGSGKAELKAPPPLAVPAELSLELEFRDPNGETQTVSSRVPLWPARRLVGLKPDSWWASQESLKFQAGVAGLDGKPLAGVPVTVELFERRVRSHRKRLVGGFYAYEHSAKTVPLGRLCSGVSDSRGLVFCAAKPPASGNLILEARVQDAEGRGSACHQEIWVAGKDEWWFPVQDSDRMDVISERRRYEPGEKASFQVRMPFRAATALVTVEREGVLDAFVRPLSGKNPVVRVPVRARYAPNAFVSVLAVRGRAGEVKPTALVDLGRPAFKLGACEIRVGWKAHELKVSVSPERAAYKVRETARVSLAVKTADGKPLPPGAEAAVAAVDEGLLELMPNQSWKLLDAMMGRRGLAVLTATAQTHVVGKRHFGLKALPQGGGGGRQTTRELFDTLLFWRGRVALDAQGRAQVEIPLNDSVTAFRIAAVASAGTGQFGTGEAVIRTSQDLMALPGLPPLAREGDRLKALFTLRNASTRTLELQVSGRVTAGADWTQALQARDLVLAPGQARELSWPVAVPYGFETLVYELSAAEKGGAADKVRVSQKVVPAVPVRVFQATLAQLEQTQALPVERPKDALPGRGGVAVLASPSLAGDLSGLERYMRAYPFGCLEQKTSKAVSLRDEGLWDQVVEALPAYLDSDGLAKYFPTMPQGSDGLTAYVLGVAHEADWPIPGELQDKMAEGLKGFVEGRVVRQSSLPTADLALRKLSAIEALSRLGKAEPKMLDSLDIEPHRWPSSGLIDWINILERLKPPRRQERLDQAQQVLRGRLNFQGTLMGFSTEASDALWWLMVSNDLNAVKLVLSRLADPAWKEDMPRLLRGALERRRRGHWDLTLANAWGRLALEKFARRFESVPVAGETSASLPGQTRTISWASQPKGATLLLPWPASRETLFLRHQGEGKPWVTLQSLAAIPLQEPLSTGYRIKKTWTPIEQKKPGRFSRGDILRVRLELSAQADRTWVVVADPVPTGSAVLGSGLGRDSTLASGGERSSGDAWPVYQERSFEAFRSYYEHVPKGDWAVEYTLRLNNEGSFQLPPTRVEAMYSPEMFGELPNQTVEVGP